MLLQQDVCNCSSGMLVDKTIKNIPPTHPLAPPFPLSSHTMSTERNMWETVHFTTRNSGPWRVRSCAHRLQKLGSGKIIIAQSNHPIRELGGRNRNHLPLDPHGSPVFTWITATEHASARPQDLITQPVLSSIIYMR